MKIITALILGLLTVAAASGQTRTTARIQILGIPADNSILETGPPGTLITLIVQLAESAGMATH